jgi:anti-sigma regulatory factor (Ser/Thr protein kinase)
MDFEDYCFARVIRVRADTAQLSRVRQFVEEVALDVAVEEERVFDLKVAVSEACANAVEHACCDNDLLEIAARVHDRRLTFVVTDSGLFRPPTQPRSAHHSRGLGLPLMVALMDEVHFTRAPGGGTTVSLSVRL